MSDKALLQKELLELLDAQEKLYTYNKYKTYFTDTGPHNRNNYSKFIVHMNAGAKYRQRAIIAGNRVGKTTCALYELVCHLTGIYPDWWQGRKFLNAVHCWAASKTNQMTKQVLQDGLLGSILDIGTGMLPKDCILRTTSKAGISDAVETVYVRHISGGISECTFKSYDQGRESFQGTYRHVILLDEEPSDSGVYSECLTRTMNKINPGIIICTFTPLLGLSDIVLSFLPEGIRPDNGIVPGKENKFITQITWDDIPHLSEEEKEELLASYSPHERAARSKGEPGKGSGAIYPYLEEDIVVSSSLEIPDYWPKAYGLDVGWNKTAAVWVAMDPDSRVFYVYSEHYVSETLPALHASAIKARGNWIVGAIDPASCGGSQKDGEALFDVYCDEGLNLELADNAIEAGILKVGQLFASGRLKILSNCLNLLAEYRIYRRDEKGHIVKKRDHAVDALRYVINSWEKVSSIYLNNSYDDHTLDSLSKLDKDKVTGY